MRRLCSLSMSLVLAGVGLAAAPSLASAEEVAASPDQTYLVTLKGDVSGSSASGAAAQAGAKLLAQFPNTGGMSVQATEGQAAALANNPLVASVEPNQRISGDGDVSGTATQTANLPWGLDRIDQRRLPLSGSYTYQSNGAGIRAYVFDSGINPNHVEFTGRIVGRVGFLNSTTPTTDSLDCHGHGTHVAGTVAGTTAGVAKGASIYAIKILDCDNRGWLADWVAAIDWMLGQHPSNVRAVANFSVSSDQPSSYINEAITRVTNRGIVAVVAAGNASANACNSSPAGTPSAITVAASTSADRQASFSNYGSCVDLYAPGESIRSSVYYSNNAYANWSGTSMAAPHVTGAAAILLQDNPGMNVAQITSTLVGNATTGVIVNPTTGTPNRLLYNPPVRTAFYLNDAFNGTANNVFSYGDPRDAFFFGDWNGDGKDTPMIRRGNQFLIRNSNSAGSPDVVVSFGDAGDVVYAGDWDGNGTDTLMIRRGNQYFVKNTIASGYADYMFAYGDRGDVVLPGDWDGDMKDTLTVRRGHQYFVKNTTSTGYADYVFGYGNPDDVVLVGDWNGDLKDTLGVRRGNQYLLKNTTTTGYADIVFGYGESTDEAFVGDFNGDNKDTIGIRR